MRRSGIRSLRALALSLPRRGLETVMRRTAWLAAVLFGLSVLSTVTRAEAQGAAPQVKPEMNESCPGLISRNSLPVIPAFHLAALKEGEVRINYIGHSTFLLESPR